MQRNFQSTYFINSQKTNDKMKKGMKKALLTLAVLAVPFALQAQTKFHDVEVHEASGPVKKIEGSQMGQKQIINFTQDGKMQQDGVTDMKYDENGYLQSATMSMNDMSMSSTYQWENGQFKGQSVNIMGQSMVNTLKRDDKGAIIGASMDMGGQKMDMDYKDIKYDAKGNWISRKITVMGQEIEQTRTIEYYE